MQLWEKILQSALLGSERTHLEPAVEEALRQYGIDPEENLPQVILSAAVTLHQIRKVRMVTEAFEHSPLDPALEEESDQTIPKDSFIDLQQILSGRFRRALPEFVQLLVSRKWLLPPEFLPELLNNCLSDRELWQDIQPLLGNRATWLIRHHPEWQYLMPQGNPDRWPDAAHGERQQILGSLRNRQPEKALPLLETIWENLPYKKKLDFLAILEEGLDLPDETFLETAREDRRKEVRQRAADLLARIPESELTRRIFAELLPLFTFDAAKEKLEVELPKTIPASTAKDGIQPTVKKGKSGGMKTAWLEECVSRIPVRYWLDHFGWNLEALVRYFDSGNRADLLLAALGRSALRFRDPALGTQIMKYLILKNRSVPADLDWQALSRQMPGDEFRSTALKALDQQPGLLEEKWLLTKIMELGVHPWNEAMTQHLVLGLKQWMAESKTFLWNLWHYKRLLESAGYCSPVGLLEELERDWPMSSPVWNQWAPDVERMLRILRFRKKMIQEK